MPSRFRSKRRRAVARHKDRLVKTKNYTYHNPQDVQAKINDEDVVGSGNFYCTLCCRYFESADVLESHERSKVHKKGLKRKRFDDDMDAKEAAAKQEYLAKRNKLTDDVDMR